MYVAGIWLWSMTGWLMLAGSARACALALAFAVDVSGSVDPREYETQMQGLAAALRDGQVAEALVSAEAAVMLVQWTGTSRQRVSVPWTRIRTFDELEAFAARVASTGRSWRNFSTAIGEALAFTRRQFSAVPECDRRVIDVSGDGVSNEGIDPAGERARMRAQNITVNALVIEGQDQNLTGYFRDNVIVGDGAFVVTANGFREYPRRIRIKLLRETTKQIAALPVPGRPDR